jgi:hypothetical protein
LIKCHHLSAKLGPRQQTIGENHLVVVGTSHMHRLAEFLPANTVVLEVAGFKLSTESLLKIQRELEELNLCESGTVVMDLLSNLAFMGTGYDGLPSLSVHGGDGRYVPCP